MKVIVVGAGALGCASALHLARAGHDVTLIERDQVASATTGFAAGILSTALVDPHDRHLVRATMAGLEALEAEHPPEGAATGPILNRPGSHLLAGEGAEETVVRELASGLAAMDVAHRVLSPHTWAEGMAARGVDASAQGLGCVLSLPDDAWALSTEATTLMARAAKAAGVTHRMTTAITGLEHSNGTVRGVRFGEGTVHADAVVLACGAWTRKLIEGAGMRLPTQAFRTHAAILRTHLARGAPILHDNPGSYYFRPESDTHLLVGDGTRTEPIDPDGFTHDAESWFIEGLASAVPRRFPAFADAQVQNQWRGVLTGVPDKAPLGGAHPDAKGLFVMTGGNGFGFMRSYALGACLAATVDGRSAPDGLPSDTLDWMAPARFWPDPPTVFPMEEGFQIHADGDKHDG